MASILPEKTVTCMQAHWGSILNQLGYKLSAETEEEASEITHAICCF